MSDARCFNGLQEKRLDIIVLFRALTQRGSLTNRARVFLFVRAR